jgi:hypothetical protein
MIVVHSVCVLLFGACLALRLGVGDSVLVLLFALLLIAGPELLW